MKLHLRNVLNLTIHHVGCIMVYDTLPNLCKTLTYLNRLLLDFTKKFLITADYNFL